MKNLKNNRKYCFEHLSRYDEIHQMSERNSPRKQSKMTSKFVF